MKVNAATKVANLNADYLDGVDSSGLVRAMRVPFNFATGATSAPITVPANVTVDLVGTTGPTGDLTIGDSAVGYNIPLRRLPGQFIVWRDSGGTLRSSKGAGTLIMPMVSLAADVSVETAGPDAIQIHNTSGNSQTGSITLMW
jgi:hypothetical protein